MFVCFFWKIYFSKKYSSTNLKTKNYIIWINVHFLHSHHFFLLYFYCYFDVYFDKWRHLVWAFQKKNFFFFNDTVNLFVYNFKLEVMTSFKYVTQYLQRSIWGSLNVAKVISYEFWWCFIEANKRGVRIRSNIK